MDLGIFSVSLAVKDIKASKAFYEKLGFKALTEYGSVEEKWLIMKNGEAKIGLFEGMFDTNTFTFNPTNARAIHHSLVDDGVAITMASDSIQAEKGPCHFMLLDPDGNPILVDQHVD